MRTRRLNPNQIITLNDYPVYNNGVLVEYFKKCKLGGELPFVTVIKKEMMRKCFDNELLEKFEKFETKNKSAKYFLLNGSHRTTALTLTGKKITAIIIKNDRDIAEAEKLIATGQIRKDDLCGENTAKECELLNQHFQQKPYFMTVEQKTQKMVREKIIPQYMIDYFKKL